MRGVNNITLSKEIGKTMLHCKGTTMAYKYLSPPRKHTPSRPYYEPFTEKKKIKLPEDSLMQMRNEYAALKIQQSECNSIMRDTYFNQLHSRQFTQYYNAKYT